MEKDLWITTPFGTINVTQCDKIYLRHNYSEREWNHLRRSFNGVEGFYVSQGRKAKAIIVISEKLMVVI